MKKNQFEALLPLKIQHIIKIIMQEEKTDFFDALELFYNSKTYDMLIDEETKFWHFSNYKIFDLWKIETKDESLTIFDV